MHNQMNQARRRDEVGETIVRRQENLKGDLLESERSSPNIPPSMNLHAVVLQILDDVLALEGRGQQWTGDTPLLGAVPELDSMAVVGLLTALSERLNIIIDDDDLDGAVFATVGTLSDFIYRRLPS